MTDFERLIAWLTARKNHITATDVASIMQIPGAYSSPMGVYLDKGTPVDTDDLGDLPEYVRWGQRLQEPILAGYAEHTKNAVKAADPYELLRSTAYPTLAASLDARWVYGDKHPVEVKNVGGFKGQEWGEAGSSDIPLHFYTQVTAQMLVTGTEVAEVAALFGGRKLEVFRVELDKEIAASIVAAAEDFWKNHIAADVPPPVDGSDEWRKYLASRRQTTTKVLSADQGSEVYASRLRRIRRIQAKLEVQENEAANKIKAAIGENEGLKGQGWRATFKQPKDRQEVDWEAVAREIARQTGFQPLEFDSLKGLATQSRPSSRRFVFTEDKKKGR